jgi:hypothetical protein
MENFHIRNDIMFWAIIIIMVQINLTLLICNVVKKHSASENLCQTEKKGAP